MYLSDVLGIMSLKVETNGGTCIYGAPSDINMGEQTPYLIKWA